MGEGGLGDSVAMKQVQQVTRGRGCLALWTGARLCSLQALFHLCHWPIASPTAKPLTSLLSCLLSLVPISSSCTVSHLNHTGIISNPQALACLMPTGCLVRGQVAPAAGRGGERQRAPLCLVNTNPGFIGTRCSALNPGKCMAGRGQWLEQSPASAHREGRDD